jgi:hypothetical protein
VDREKIAKEVRNKLMITAIDMRCKRLYVPLVFILNLRHAREYSKPWEADAMSPLVKF